ncbi:hypothetical protein TSAR_006110 [Trichomalopsis sarcophagae]|uniref:Uncharacterized protein n=1 Tax=Trichomalopsis sarcophagae TaxID=543379 RepID=A0A232EYR3_9HYME|nr:hypothetical protein TSAR_006110 [Trichomalopsis sarcophagae]
MLESEDGGIVGLFADGATALVGLEEVLGAAHGLAGVLPVALAVGGGLSQAAGGGTGEQGADDLGYDFHGLRVE